MCIADSTWTKQLQAAHGLLPVLQALATVQNVRKGMIVAGSAALLTMAALAGHEGLQPSSGLMAAAVTASGAMAAYLVAGKLEAQFVYTDWDNRYH